MAAAWLGAEQLAGVLYGGSRLVISNRAADATTLILEAVVVVLHGDDGSRRLKAAQGLALFPGKSEIIDDLPPAATPLVAAEAFLQFRHGETHRMLDGYATIEGTAATPLDSIEVGIVDTAGAEAVGGTPLPDAPDYAVFARVDA